MAMVENATSLRQVVAMAEADGAVPLRR